MKKDDLEILRLRLGLAYRFLSCYVTFSNPDFKTAAFNEMEQVKKEMELL